MLLQTNSYIVPRDKRAEHARLLRRFRQTLLRLGCDHFEVYEQVGPNWSSADSSGRFVQIMRFRDRKHQMAVQGAERSDAAAQALLKEFCDLINLPYQQQQGLFAVGYYTSFLRMPQRLEGPDSFAAPAETSVESASEETHGEETPEETAEESAAESISESPETAESPAVEEMPEGEQSPEETPAEAEGSEPIALPDASDETSTEQAAAEEPVADGEAENIETESQSHSDSEAATAADDSEDSLDQDGLFASDGNGDPTEAPDLAHPVSDPEDETESSSSGTEAQSDETQSDEAQSDDDESEVSPKERPSTPFSS